MFYIAGAAMMSVQIRIIGQRGQADEDRLSSWLRAFRHLIRACMRFKHLFKTQNSVFKLFHLYLRYPGLRCTTPV